MKAFFATSTLIDGPMGRNVALMPEDVIYRRKFVVRNFGDYLPDGVTTENVHGTHIHLAARATDNGIVITDCDGLITTECNFPIFVTHQDCVPIFITDEISSFVCVLHAGWRGVAGGILRAALRRIVHEFQKESSVIRVHFGPAIQACHFEVKEDVAWQFQDYVVHRDGKMFVDLHTVLRDQAFVHGVRPEGVTRDGRCTFCAKENGEFVFPSYRREGDRSKNMISVALLRN